MAEEEEVGEEERERSPVSPVGVAPPQRIHPPPQRLSTSGDPVQLVNQECRIVPQSLRGRKTIVTRREGRIKIPSTRTPPFGTSMAASELGGFKFAVLHGEKMVYKNYTSKIMFGGRS